MVTDAKTGKAVGFVTVKALNANDSLLAYAMTDGRGTFRLTLDSSAEALEFSFMGYDKKRIKAESAGTDMKVKLTPSGIMLKELTVKAKPIERRHDTINYNVAAFKDKSDRYIFFAGTVLGGAYEYMCSVLSELLFGTVFWDYSHIPFNLGGRINLLYCFFWGIAAVVWLKSLYPRLSRLIESLPVTAGAWLMNLLIVFMAVNLLISGMALGRYAARHTGSPQAQTRMERILDERFPDERIERIYPNAKLVD